VHNGLIYFHFTRLAEHPPPRPKQKASRGRRMPARAVAGLVALIALGATGYAVAGDSAEDRPPADAGRLGAGDPQPAR
jgi:hypothetical protein